MPPGVGYDNPLEAFLRSLGRGTSSLSVEEAQQDRLHDAYSDVHLDTMTGLPIDLDASGRSATFPNYIQPGTEVPSIRAAPSAPVSRESLPPPSINIGVNGAARPALGIQNLQSDEAFEGGPGMMSMEDLIAIQLAGEEEPGRPGTGLEEVTTPPVSVAPTAAATATPATPAAAATPAPASTSLAAVADDRYWSPPESDAERAERHTKAYSTSALARGEGPGVRQIDKPGHPVRQVVEGLARGGPEGLEIGSLASGATLDRLGGIFMDAAKRLGSAAIKPFQSTRQDTSQTKPPGLSPADREVSALLKQFGQDESGSVAAFQGANRPAGDRAFDEGLGQPPLKTAIQSRVATKGAPQVAQRDTQLPEPTPPPGAKLSAEQLREQREGADKRVEMNIDRPPGVSAGDEFDAGQRAIETSRLVDQPLIDAMGRAEDEYGVLPGSSDQLATSTNQEDMVRFREEARQMLVEAGISGVVIEEIVNNPDGLTPIQVLERYLGSEPVRKPTPSLADTADLF
jgi:hypothetical protein